MSDEIANAIRDMRKRLQSGQGEVSSAMCRLSLRMSEQLLAERDACVEVLREIVGYNTKAPRDYEEWWMDDVLRERVQLALKKAGR